MPGEGAQNEQAERQASEAIDSAERIRHLGRAPTRRTVACPIKNACCDSATGPVTCREPIRGRGSDRPVPGHDVFSPKADGAAQTRARDHFDRRVKAGRDEADSEEQPQANQWGQPAPGAVNQSQSEAYGEGHMAARKLGMTGPDLDCLTQHRQPDGDQRDDKGRQ